MLSKEWYEKIKKDSKVWRDIKKIEGPLTEARVDLPVFYKLRIAEFVLRLQKRFQKKFGLFIIFGWRDEWRKKYAGIPDISQNIFKKHHVRIFEFQKKEIQDLGDERFISRHVRRLINFDGSILIDKNGLIVDSGVYIEGLRPKEVIRKLNPRGERDLSLQFGFKRKVHARHLAAITASYIFKKTTIFTLSEETGDFHIFEEGRIVYSTVSGEMAKKGKKSK